MPNPSPLKRQSSKCTVKDPCLATSLIASVKCLASSENILGQAMLKNFSKSMLSKNKCPSTAEIMAYDALCWKVLQILPSGDPSWGVLREVAKVFLETLKAIDDLAKAWDERILADQFASVLFHFRKLLRSPGMLYKAMADLQASGEDQLLKSLQLLLDTFEEDILEKTSSESSVVLSGKAEEEAILAIEDQEAEAPEMKFRYHLKLKEEKKRLEASKKAVKAIDKELAFLFKSLGKENQGAVKTRTRTRQAGCRRYLPHKTLGELQLNLATKKSYICYKNMQEGPKHCHFLTVTDTCLKHQEVCAELFEQVSSRGLIKSEAVQLRATLIKAAQP